MDAEKDYIELKKWLDETKDVPLEGMASFFDKRIDSYEDHMAQWHEHYKYMAELVPFNAENLLDIGCGSGLELDCIFKKMPDIKVTGVDLSSEMLALLKRKHRDKNLTIVQDDYFLHDFGEKCYDVIVSFETLHHFTAEKKTELFRKIYNALVPGGVYLECDYTAVSQKIEDMVFDEYKRRFKRDKIAPGVFVHFDTPLTVEHETQAMRNAGFESIEIMDYLGEDDHTAMIRAIK